MKKYFFLISVAALAMTACTNESEEYVGSQESKEIAFTPLNQNATRAGNQYAVDGTGFPTDIDMKVAAYQVEATGGSAGVYFDATTFKYQYVGGSGSGSGSYWGGETAKYWPLSPAYINFLAIANANADNATDVTWGTNKADQVKIIMSDNSSAQRDLMYARGNGAVTQSGNVLSFPEKVDMEFKHAQAWIDFKVKANSSVETAITINSITLTGAKYNGTYQVTHTNYNSKTSQSVSGAWSALGAAQNIAVPGWAGAPLTTSFVTVGKGLMIVPDDAATGDFTSFTISYTYDSKNYTYTYTPASTQVEQAKHYIYEITFKLHEIFINPTVEDWADQAINYVEVPTLPAGTNRTLNVSTAETTYTYVVSGFAANETVYITKTDANNVIKTLATEGSVSADANGNLTVTFTVNATSGANDATIFINSPTDEHDTTITISQPAS